MSFGEDDRFLKIKIFETPDSFFERQYPPEGEIVVGRKEDCDLVLASMRISKKHCRIYFRDGHWHIEDLSSQNGTFVNDSKIDTELLRDKDEIKVGGYRIEVEWKPGRGEEPVPDADDDRTVVLATPEDEDATMVGPGPSPEHDAETSLTGKIKTLLRERKVAAALGGVLLLLIILIALPGSREEAPDSAERHGGDGETASETVHDMETRDRINVYLQSGRDQLEAGNYSQALVRFQAVLEVDPDNHTARSHLARTRQAMARAEEKRRQALEEEQQRMERVRAIMSRARQAMAQNDYSGASEIIAEAVFLEPDNPDVAKLSADIEKAIRDRQLTRRQKEEQRAEKTETIRRHFERGQRHYEEKNYREALKEWEKVLAVDAKTAETEHTRYAIAELRNLLEDEIRADYEKAVALHESGDLTGALGLLEKVAQVSPDYRDTRKLMAEVFLQVESKARRLYQEGLVYEGLGQQQKASEKWREVLRVMPLADNHYRQSASDKLQ